MRNNVKCLSLSLFLTLCFTDLSRAQDSLSDLLQQTIAQSAAARTIAFKTLGNYWSPFPYVQDPQTGKSVKHEIRSISDEELDSIALAIKQGLADKNPKVRLAAAGAMVSAPRESAACAESLQAGFNSQDSEVRQRFYNRLYVSNAQLPKIERVIETIILDVKNNPHNGPFYFNSCFFAYGSQLKPYSKRLIGAIFHDRRPEECPTGILPSVSLSDEAATELILHAEKVREPVAEYAFKAMLEHPHRLHELQKKQPKLADYLAKSFPALIYKMLCQENEQSKHLRAWLLDQEKLSPTMMAFLGSKKFIGEIDKLEPSASLHREKYLEACKQACGMSPERTVRASATQPITFRPPSATPEGDKTRIGEHKPFCGLGSCNLLVIGTVLTADGKPPAQVKFTELITRYDQEYQPLPEPDREARPVIYNSENGSFVLFKLDTATFGSKMELGPYKTHETNILIEAEGCQPLEVEFFDEMPHVEIRLNSKPSA